jgi:hypothetical protein
MSYCRELIEGKELDLDKYVDAVVCTQEVVDALFALHEKLSLLTGRTENQTTYDFVRKLEADCMPSQADSWLPSIPSIALTDSYNFIEHDLRNILSNELQGYGFEALPPQSRNVVLALPKAEVDNPLMWAILAHETAHAMISSYKILESEILARSPEYSESTDEMSRQVYRNWSLEICADLIALRILGPSYYFSFASMGLLLHPQATTEDHPPIIERIGIMSKVLERHYPSWIVECPADTCHSAFSDKSLVVFFRRLALYKHRLTTEDRYRKFFLHPGSFLETEALQFLPNTNIILKALDRVHVPTVDLFPPEKQRVILGMLSAGQLVSSYPETTLDKELFRAKLRGAKNAPDLYQALPPPEKPLTLSTILACGWLLKIYNNFSDLLIDVVKKQSLAQTLNSYQQVLATRSELLQNSLSRAFMMQMYWRWREVLDEPSTTR